MTNKHKIFREIFELSPDEMWKMEECMRLMADARVEFERVGVPFTYEAFVAYVERLYNGHKKAAASFGSSSPITNRYSDILKIVKGDNLDLIEHKAKKKKLI